MRLLIVDSSPRSASSISSGFAQGRVNATVAESGEEAVDYARVYDFDAIVLDEQLSDMKASACIKSLRQAGIAAPVIVLAAGPDVQSRVDLLKSGADDVVARPYHADELDARIGAVVRRSQGHASSVIDVQGLQIDLGSRTVSLGGKPVPLSPKEYEMLELLALRKGCTIGKETFLNHLYGGMDEPEQKIIDVYMCKMRKKIEDVMPGHNPIETVWGRGYVLRENKAA